MAAKSLFPADRRLALTLANEIVLREFLFNHFWKLDYAKKIVKAHQQLASGKLDAGAMLKVKQSRHFKRATPLDLSGGCKVSAQVALRVFSLEGEVVSNPRHTFVWMNGQVYDLNRNCLDVNSMLDKDRQPYEVDLVYSRGQESQMGLASWQPSIDTLLPVLWTYVQGIDDIKYHSGEPLKKLPDWAINHRAR